jgi:deoxyribodipyrimidine photo-lyase
VNILWFRRDLRLSDNEIVTLAAADDRAVLPCFVIDPWFYQHSEVGKARVKFLFQSLENLDANLRKLGSQLYLFEGNSITIIQTLTLKLQQQGYRPKLHFNRDVQVQYGVDRDRSLIEFYQNLKLDYHVGCNNLLAGEENQPDRWNQQYYSYQEQPEHPTPKRINSPQLALDLPQLIFSELKQKYSAFWEVNNRYFTGGETQARAILKSFLHRRYRGYHWKLSRPWLAQRGATSHLSPHLTFGTISTRQVFRRTQTLIEQLQERDPTVFRQGS